MILKVISRIVLALVALVILQQVLMGVFWSFARRMDSGWSGEHQEPGPVPLSSPNAPIIRLVNKRTTFELGTQRELRWEEGKGPIKASERIKPLLDAVPKELEQRLAQTVRVPSKLPDDKRMADYRTYEVWSVVVSLNPDVLIICAHELPMSNDVNPLRDWGLKISPARAKYIDGRIDPITLFISYSSVFAGTLVPWNTEMYVVSTDPQIKSGPLKFSGNRAEITWPTGKLVLMGHNEDVDVTRE